jgi:small ligand-binding sensory domain FIST
MKFASSLSQLPDPARASREAIQSLCERLGGAVPDLVCAFGSPHHAGGWSAHVADLREAFPGAALLGCSGQGVIGAGREAEGSPGLALTGAALPDVRLHPFEIADDRLPDVPAGEDASVLVLCDPFDAGIETVLGALDTRFPGGTILGGVASGGEEPGANWLQSGETTLHGGSVALALEGDLALDAVVSQGCRPVGTPMFAESEGNVVLRLDGRAPMDVLNELYAAAPPAEQRLYGSSLFLGIEMREAQSSYDAGDFLVRNLVGADEDSGALHVAAEPGPRRVVQFHVRYADAARDDLQRRLGKHAENGPAPHGALLFSCMGRGQRLFGEPDHDSEALFARFGRLPLGGFFGNGEVGPVQGRTFLHGYTSAFGLFSPKGGETTDG